MNLLLQSLKDTLEQVRSRHRRRIPFLGPPLERRRPRILAEDYAARHSIEHTLDRKAELRRLADRIARYDLLLVPFGCEWSFGVGGEFLRLFLDLAMVIGQVELVHGEGP